tara:strand:- start:14357 stop:17701 length:3345 start_codon:yes stop_codon:yes gene_type:complete
LTDLLKSVPGDVLPKNAADAAELLSALHGGIVRKDEPKYNQEAAYSAYLDIAALINSRLTDEDQSKLLEELVLPILGHYLRPSVDTSQWTIPSNATRLLSKALRIDGMAAAVGARWLQDAQKLVDAIKTSAPEQSKDYETSQLAVAQQASRFATIQEQALKIEAFAPVQPVFMEASSTVVSEALNVVKNRNGKPYGAAATVAAILSRNSTLILGGPTQQFLDAFLRDDLPGLISSPSSAYLIEVLYAQHERPVFPDTWRASLSSALKEPESPANSKALAALLTSPRIPTEFDLATQDVELQKFIMNSVRESVEGSNEWDSFNRILQSQAKILAPETTDDILSYMTQSLTISQRAPHSLHGLRQIVRSNPSLLKGFVATSEGPKLLQSLLLASESANDEVAQGALAVNASIQTMLAAGSDTKKSMLELIHQGLREANQASVSVETLVDVAKQSVKAGDGWDVLQSVLPSLQDWDSALTPFLEAPPKPALAITNPLGGAVYLVKQHRLPSEIHTEANTHSSASNQSKVHTGNVSRDADGYSAAYRITQYVTRLFKESEMFPVDVIPSSTLDAYLRNIALTVQLADDNLGMAGANGLWSDYNTDVESDAMAFITDAQTFVTHQLKRLSSAWTEGSSSSLMVWAEQLLSQIESTVSPKAYYTARTYSILVSDAVDIIGWRNAHTQTLQDTLKTVRRSKAILSILTYLNAFKEPLATTKSCERMCNELVADLTGLDIDQKPEDGLRQLLQLNSVLYGQDGIVESIAKQRLVFFVKHVVPWLHATDTSKAVNAELCRALTVLLPLMSDMYGEHWADILNALAAAWSASQELEKSEAATENYIPFVHASLKLYAQLRSLTQTEEPNDDLLDAWKETEQAIANGLINLLKHSEHFPDEFHQPLKMVNDVLARQIAKVSLKHLESTEELYPLLYVESQPVQQTAFDILHKQIPEAQEQISIDSALEKSTARLPEELLSLIIDAPTVAALAEANFERNVPLPLRGYLLSWLLVFDHLEHASFKVKNDYVDHIKEGEYLPGLLNFTFDFLGHAHNKPVDVSKLDITIYQPDIEPPKRDLQWLLTHLYFLCLKHVPSLAKAWFIDCKSRATVVTLEPWTEKHVRSP